MPSSASFLVKTSEEEVEEEEEEEEEERWRRRCDHPFPFLPTLSLSLFLL